MSVVLYLLICFLAHVSDHSIGIIITMVGQIILDWNADSSDTPARSYMLDVFNPEDLEKALAYRALVGGKL